MIKSLVVKLRSIFLYTLFLVNFLAFGGFPAGTLIQRGQAYVPLEELHAGDMVTCYDFKAGYTEKPILAITTRTANETVFLVINGVRIFTSKDQKFYVPDQKRWKRAVDLRVGDSLFGSRLEEKSCIIQQIFCLEDSTILYDISVKDCHNFLILKDGILVHNFMPVLAVGAVFTFKSLFALATYELSSVFATAAVGSAVLAGSYLLKNNNDNNWQSNCSGNSSPQGSGSGPSGNNNNDDDKNNDNKKSGLQKAAEAAAAVAKAAEEADKKYKEYKKKEKVLNSIHSVANKTKSYCSGSSQTNQHANYQQKTGKYWQNNTTKTTSPVNSQPNGRYHNAGYHSKSGYSSGYNGGTKSPSPINGQAALNSSIPIQGSDRHRVGVSENQIVILNQTRIGEYHGHVRTFDELKNHHVTRQIANDLIKHGYVCKKGKIL